LTLEASDSGDVDETAVLELDDLRATAIWNTFTLHLGDGHAAPP
jgi:hypothetical protein